MILSEVLERSLARNCLHPPHSGRYAAFFENLDQPDLSGSAGMRAAAQFGGEIPNLDDPHLVAIFLAEQRHGFVFVHSYINGNILDEDRKSTRLNSSHRCISYAVF